MRSSRRRLPRSFRRAFPDEDACRAALHRARWPDGFVCPVCAHDDAAYLAGRAVWQCRACRRQTSVTAGTALHASKLPLRAWLYAIWRVGRRRGRIGARALMRELGLGSYRTAWALLHKLRLALREGPMCVDGPTLQLLFAALPPDVVAKRSRAGRSTCALQVVAQRSVRARVRAAAPSVPRASGGRARRFFAGVVRTLGMVHGGIASSYAPSYVRALVFIHNRTSSSATLLEALLAALVRAQRCSVGRITGCAQVGSLDEAV